MSIYLQRLSKKRAKFKTKKGDQLSWFRASGLHPEGRRFESVIAHKKSFDNSDDFFYFGEMFYCYILYSGKLDKYYIGSTSNLEGRIQRHHTSNKGFISTGKPWTIKYFESFETKTQAIQREFQIKRWKDRQKLEDLISVGPEYPG